MSLCGPVFRVESRFESGFDNFDDFTPFILAAMRTGAMRTDLFMAVRTFRKLRQPQRVVRSAVRGTAFRMAAFGIRHESVWSFLKIFVLLYYLRGAISLRSIFSLLHRSSAVAGAQPQSCWFRFCPQSGQIPRQFSLQTSCIGRAKSITSRRTSFNSSPSPS